MFGYDSPDKLIETVNGTITLLYAEPSDREELLGLLRENEEVLDYNLRVFAASIIWYNFKFIYFNILTFNQHTLNSKK